MFRADGAVGVPGGRSPGWPYYQEFRNKLGAERGWGPAGRNEFDREAGLHGSMYVGSPETVARTIATTVSTLGAARFDLKYTAGRLPHHLSMRTIELYGTRVAPLVHELLADQRQPVPS